jgi:hypothetical protein
MKGDIENAAIVVCTALILVLGLGEPDLIDAIIYWLTDGKLQPNP